MKYSNFPMKYSLYQENIYVTNTYVPLLYWEKVSAQFFPDVAILLATIVRIPSNTVDLVTYLYKAGLLFPIVVSWVAWNKLW